jgi:ring-1,2-phenylacetyl-CoA epoxidase subunit PaaC
MAEEAEADLKRLLLTELLFQLADDDFVAGARAAEWLGTAPQLEEDVAFASIAQDEMGHATAYYGLLEDLGVGRRDDLAHLRPADARRNSVLLERPNGSQDAEAPRWHWAFALARHLLYDTLERARLDRLVESSHVPLAQLAAKIRREERYHEAHHRVWLRVLAGGGAPARQRLTAGLYRAFADAGDLAFTGPWAKGWEATHLMPDASGLERDWRERVAHVLSDVGMPTPTPAMDRNGRLGFHTADLDALVDRAGEVARSDPGAMW